MYKPLLIVAALTVGMLNAHAQQPIQARYTLGVYSIDDLNRTISIADKKLSISNPNHYMCWSLLLDTPITDKTLNSKEIFYSPTGGQFHHDNSDIQSSPDGTHHIITSVAEVIDQTLVERCWQFDSSDPTGSYKLDVEVAGFALPSQTFTIVP
ncbi:hypothetical protein [Moraxella nasicaprae]|uniref:DUF4424 domain-containing protein n=1 Tax=Moraxella nasicaprae TaxID=2904122 RepID=A0ABY6F3B0_9GAMM|nr:hypothetical protein [Moraxella nasicaprae]UXZ04584.1 hypothetical protein LU297_08390 [Moraxella nasicaprae]